MARISSNGGNGVTHYAREDEVVIEKGDKVKVISNEGTVIEHTINPITKEILNTTIKKLPDRIREKPVLDIPLPDLPIDQEIPRFAGNQTTTLLTQYAIDYLNKLSSGSLQSALGYLRAQRPAAVPPNELFQELDQRTKLKEVLRETAEGWSSKTRSVFASVFSMDANKFNEMDAIVSIALLNRPELERILRDENVAPPTIQELLESRKIVWQYPPPGTPLTPPYVILVAVENLDIGPAEDVVRQIMSTLVDTSSGYRLPREAAQKLG